MAADKKWLLLAIVYLMSWLCGAVIHPNTFSVCEHDACQCVVSRGRARCDCSTSKTKDVIIQTSGYLLPGFSSITIANCSHVHITSTALKEVQNLRQVALLNITSLVLNEESFCWEGNNHHHDGVTVRISNTSIPDIPSYCFKGDLQGVHFNNVQVGNVQAFAFSALHKAEKIEFVDTEFLSIEPQAFKKFSVNFFIISGGHIHSLPTRSMVDVEVDGTVRLENMKVDIVKSSAIRIHGPSNFRLTNSNIGSIEHNAFHVHTRGGVSIHENVFANLATGAFAGFAVERRYLHESGRPEFVFENNTLVSFDYAPLIFNTTGFDPMLDWIIVNQKCTCVDSKKWGSQIVFYASDTQTSAPSVGTVVYCQHTGLMRIQEYQRLFCSSKGYSIYIMLLVILGCIVCISCVALLIYWKYKKHNKRYINVCTSPSAMKLAESSRNNHMMVLPDGKTYRETELHVIVEHAQPITPLDYNEDKSSLDSDK